MNLTPSDIDELNALVLHSFLEIDEALKSVSPPVQTDFGCTSGVAIRIFSFMTVRIREPVVFGLTVLQGGTADSLVVHADVVVDDTGSILLEEPVTTLVAPPLASLLETAGAMASRLCRRALETDLLGLRPER